MSKYATISIPRRLADDIKQFMEETGYWTSIGSFVREAAIQKLHVERERRRKEAEG